MKRKMLGLLCLLVLSAPLFADMSKAELQNMYLEYLRSRNIQAQVNNYGDIEFRYEGEKIFEITFWIAVDETDQQHFQIFTTGIYPLQTNEDRLKAPIAAAKVSGWVNVAKIFIWEDGSNISIIAGAYLVNPQDFRAIFPKLMLELDDIMSYFLDEMY